MSDGRGKRGTNYVKAPAEDETERQRQNVEGRGKRGTNYVKASPSTEQDATERRGRQGTVVDAEVTAGMAKAVAPSVGFVDDDGNPISTADRVPTSVKFRRDSIIRQICIKEDATEPSSPSKEPEKGALKRFNRHSIRVGTGQLLCSSDSNIGKYAPSEDLKEEFLCNYGFTEVMKRKILSQCSQIYHLTVLMDNGTSMKSRRGKCIEGKKKEAEWLKLPPEERLAYNEEGYDLSLEPCTAVDEAQDVAFFLLQLAANMALPATFQLLDSTRKIGGIGKGFRRVGTPIRDGKMIKAEDYIPHEEQVESALEMIEMFPDLLVSSTGNAMKLIEGVKKHYEDELVEIEKKDGKAITVLIITSAYPWGRRGGDSDIPQFKKDFIDLVNGFNDLPVTFIFIVESQQTVNFYDELLSDSSIKADLRVAKGLGLMLNGISKHNPWLNYCLPMHLIQVLGIGGSVLSQAAATRALTAAEVREVCNMLIGDVPDPTGDKEKFYAALDTLMSDDANKRWNPNTGEYGPIIDVVKLKKHLNKISTSWFAGCHTGLFSCHRCRALVWEYKLE